MFGQAGQATYLSHPLVMLPVDYSIRILGGSGRIMAALTGFALSIFWLNVVFSALSKAPSFRRNGVLLSLALCLFFVSTFLVSYEVLSAPVGPDVGALSHL